MRRVSYLLAMFGLAGKMLLDEKEADAEAHEGEKEALWRRIQVRRKAYTYQRQRSSSRLCITLQCVCVIDMHAGHAAYDPPSPTADDADCPNIRIWPGGSWS